LPTTVLYDIGALPQKRGTLVLAIRRTGTGSPARGPTYLRQVLEASLPTTQ